ncbi:MAG: hypothetical protein M0R75_13370, partial [Dehalococcoidia bacterium]|nr:hypothetical protein [Dehalococcoidia bacterium]
MEKHSAPLRAVDGLPSYEEVLCPRTSRSKTGLTDALRAMKPGDVIDATDLTQARAKQHSIRGAAAVALGPGQIATRLIDGRVYVARLLPQHGRG